MDSKVKNLEIIDREIFRGRVQTESEQVPTEKPKPNLEWIDYDKPRLRGRFTHDKEGNFVPYVKPPTPEVFSVITDEIPPTESMATPFREIFTSKRKLFKHYRENGFIDTGGEQPKQRPRPRPNFEQIRDAALKAYHDIKNHRVPMTEWEKHICEQEQRKYQEYKKAQKR